MQTTHYRIFTILLVLCIGIGMLPASAAKRTFNSKGEKLYIVEKEGVIVTLYDCREATGHDQSGRLTFNNTSNVPVTIEYQVYGITDKGAKYLVDKGSQQLRQKENLKYAIPYSYRDNKINGKWKYKDFAVAIKLVKSNVKDDPKAKRTRNSANDELYIIEKDGVTATLYDRRESTGYDRTGKVMLANDNVYPVVVEYQVYGIDVKGGKHLVHKDSQSLDGKQKPTWGYTYQYGDEHSNNKDLRKYEKYAMAMKVTASTPTEYTDSYDKNYEIFYNKAQSGAAMTQDDYVMGIKIAEYYTDMIMAQINSMGKQLENLGEQGAKAVYSKYKKEADRLEWLAEYLDQANRAGRFSSNTQSIYERTQRKYGKG